MTPATTSGSTEPPPPKHWAVRLARVVVGFVLLMAGVAMLALPGPGWLSIGLGLTLLASEFRWARRLLVRLRKVIRKYVPRRSKAASNTPHDSKGSGTIE